MFSVNKFIRPLFTALLGAAAITGCGGSSSDSDSTGYVKFYNASQNAPYIYFELNEAPYSGADFARSNGMYELDSDSYDMTLSWKEDSSEYNTIGEQTININDEKVTFVVLSGDVSEPLVHTWQYEDEDPETEDNQFTFRWLNVHPEFDSLDVYLSKDDETFNEAVLLSNLQQADLTDSHYYELDSYKFYLTGSGSTEVLYESEEIPFIYTSQYIMVIRANTGPGGSAFTIDRLSKTGSGVAYADVNAGAEVKIYNGLAQHPLLEQFNDKVDIQLDGLAGNIAINELAKGQFSQTLGLGAGDYAVNISPSDNETAIATNRFLSLPANSDRTLFVFLTEAEEYDSDTDTDEVVLNINTMPVDNSNRISLYDHRINIINLVDDFTGLNVYFVRSNETVDSAEHHLFANSGIPNTISLENNSFDVSVIGSDNGSELLLAFDQLTLDSESGDMFMVIEEAPQTPSGYSVKFVSQ